MSKRVHVLRWSDRSRARHPIRIRHLLDAARHRDPRLYQIAVLGSLLLYGVAGLDLEVRPLHAGLVVATALAVQALGSRRAGIAFDPRSPLVSSLSLALLLRTDLAVIAVLAAAVAIGGKFLLRLGDKHLFNPANLGLVVAMLVTDRAWVSPGQWGSPALLALAVACLGLVVVRRAARSDVTWAFLAAYGGLVLGRAAWLGDPWAVPLHHLQSGALLIFAFFMISDPKTTPDSRAGRILYAVLVAAVAGWITFALFRTNGLIWALAVCAPVVPLLDRLLPGGRYRWTSAPRRVSPPPRAVPDGRLVPDRQGAST